MTQDRSIEIKRRAAATRFRQRRAELAVELRSMLGDCASMELIADAAQAATLDAEFWVSLRAAEPNNWAFVERTWPANEVAKVSNVLHGLSRHLGRRPVWISWGQREPQAAALESDVALDNPLGFAALADCELRLRDREIAAGLWLGRHSHHDAPRKITYSWELNVWGEFWHAAALRAFEEFD